MDLETRLLLLSKCLPKYHEMDKMSEDLLPDSTHLRDGMVVIVERSATREDLSAIHDSASKLEAALRYNRWCTVSNIEHRGQETHFVAEYEDGTKRKISAHPGWAWYVKIDSVMVPFLKENEAVFQLVFKAIQDGRDPNGLADHLIATNTADKIVDLFIDLISEK